MDKLAEIQKFKELQAKRMEQDRKRKEAMEEAKKREQQQAAASASKKTPSSPAVKPRTAAVTSGSKIAAKVTWTSTS